ncbi:conserved hypothetical protein [uncultured Desulfobacterium sp.]|uniref:TIGR02757 family protein n=1 Tax=uncultured Desulfobacterium sp. TaxID=201089 RepID=A0A445N0E3_9BACT|nr:conserved hypothetical protein [uncultured Desulfobacterium sp.]
MRAVFSRNEDLLKSELDSLYAQFNNRQYLQYDPIRYVHEFEDHTEMELAGMLCSALSFGRVTQIFKAIEAVLKIVEGRPLEYVLNLKNRPDRNLLSFKYRFVTGNDVFNLFISANKIMEAHGSIGNFVMANYCRGNLLGLVDAITRAFRGVNYLVPSSLKASPCKRLFMFLRWMVRKDNIDIGLWDFISPKELVIPLDTHIFRVSKELGFTSKKAPSLNAAIEITDSLKRFCKEDPVKYDWALSHIGIIENNF